MAIIYREKNIVFGVGAAVLENNGRFEVHKIDLDSGRSMGVEYRLQAASAIAAAQTFCTLDCGIGAA